MEKYVEFLRKRTEELEKQLDLGKQELNRIAGAVIFAKELLQKAESFLEGDQDEANSSDSE